MFLRHLLSEGVTLPAHSAHSGRWRWPQQFSRSFSRSFPILIGFTSGICLWSSVANALPWDWGEQYYESKFPVPIVVQNDCESAQIVRFEKRDLPFLKLPPQQVVGPKSTITAWGEATLPPPPPPPLLTGLPGEPGYGWVEPPQIINPPGQFPPLTFHQPNFSKIEGSVDATLFGNPKNCYTTIFTYNATGHMHFRPPEPPKGPERILENDACATYWNTGERPLFLKEDCTERMREMASNFVNRVLAHYIANDPAGWSWLMAIDINRASMGQMLAMKARASLQTGNPGSSDYASQSTEPSGDGSNTALRSGVSWSAPSVTGNPCADVWNQRDAASVPQQCLGEVREAVDRLSLAAQERGATPLGREGRIASMDGGALMQTRNQLRGQLQQIASRSAQQIKPPAGTCGELWRSPARADASQDKQCTASLRKTASKWHQTVASPLRAAQPADMQWLPSADAIKTMTSNEILSLKAKLDEVSRMAPREGGQK